MKPKILLIILTLFVGSFVMSCAEEEITPLDSNDPVSLGSPDQDKEDF
ncbi:MAG: hypothetical protein AAF149_17620 [Bacteroidota bacterium]